MIASLPLCVPSSRPLEKASALMSSPLRSLRPLVDSFSTPEFGQQAAAQIPGGHITLLLDTLTDTAVRVAIDEGCRAYLKATGT